MERPAYYGNPAGVTGDLEVVRSIYGAFARRDLEAVLAHVDPDCELVAQGTAEAAGHGEPYRGHEGVRRYFRDVAQVWDELTLHADDFRVVPGSVIVLGHVTARSGSRPIRRSVVWTWRLRDGRASHLRVADMGELP